MVIVPPGVIAKLRKEKEEEKRLVNQEISQLVASFEVEYPISLDDIMCRGDRCPFDECECIPAAGSDPIDQFRPMALVWSNNKRR